MGQSAGVVVTVIVQPHQLHIGLARQQPRHQGDTRQAATGEDVALDEIHPAQILGIALVGDGNGLNEQATTRLEQPRQLAEIIGQEGVPHRFDHLDGDQLVVSPSSLR